MKTGEKIILAALICALGAGGACAAGAAPERESGDAAARSGFQARLLGPGIKNLSVGDPLAQYQWGLKNYGELQYIEIVNKYRDSDPLLALTIDIANMVGAEAPVEGPDAYEQDLIQSVRGVDINILPAWELYDASTEEHREVIVAVIDTGIDISHPDLAGSIWVNEDEIPDDGIDNDGNGYIDDVNGWNFFYGTNQVYNGQEDNHGTHAAGTIAATRSEIGIAGICDNRYVKVMPVKALGSEAGRGEAEAVIAAIRYAEENGASICNISFGTTDNYPELEQVMRESDMLFVVAAGNGDTSGNGYDIDVYPDYPSSYHLDNVISVANLMFDGNLAVSSNYGVNTVHIAAPGTYILSTIAENGYGYMSGTSMAAPMVTGTAAFLYSYRKDLSLAQVKDVILATAKQLPGLAGKVTCGGVVDVFAAITYGQDAAGGTAAADTAAAAADVTAEETAAEASEQAGAGT